MTLGTWKAGPQSLKIDKRPSRAPRASDGRMHFRCHNFRPTAEEAVYDVSTADTGLAGVRQPGIISDFIQDVQIQNQNHIDFNVHIISAVTGLIDNSLAARLSPWSARHYSTSTVVVSQDATFDALGS